MRLLLAGMLLAASVAGADTWLANGRSRYDCLGGFRIGGDGPLPAWSVDRRRERLTCTDGDSACDADRTRDHVCTFDVSLCVLLAGDDACTPETAGSVKRLIVRRSDSVREAGIPRLRGPHLAATAPGCGESVRITLPPRVRPDGTFRSSRTVTPFRVVAVSTALSPTTGAPRRDADRLSLRCLPALPEDCAGEPNPDGGPGMLTLELGRAGVPGDFDLGWTGRAHNAPAAADGRLRFCLSGCNGGARSSCTGTALRRRVFGVPRPIVAANVPICLVHRFDPAVTSMVTADHRTGEIEATFELLTDFYITSTAGGAVCPQCSGAGVGMTGTCLGGVAAGSRCEVEGTALVTEPSGQSTYMLSSACLPSLTNTGVSRLHVALGTGTARLDGPRPCPGQIADDGCGLEGTCNATCTGPACETSAPDPAAPAETTCIDHLGGISQRCCSNDTTLPCHPTRDGGSVTRTGVVASLVPDAPGTSFPATATPVLAGASCAEAITSNVLNNVAGLPGPVTIVLPATARWTP